MLSRKQLWRKTRSSSTVKREDQKSLLTALDLAKLTPINDSSAINDSYDTNAKALLPKKLRSALNLVNLLSESDKAMRPKDTRTMRFSSTVHICLIP